MFLCGGVIAQTKSIGGEINKYSKVKSINDIEKSVTLEDASIFKQEELPDTVLLVQMTGMSTSGGWNDTNTVGLYEFHIVTQVNGSTVSLLSTPGAFDTDELVQMVRIPSYKNAQIDNKLISKKWDWGEGTGGILALIVNETLTFNADIDVSESGFRGGKVSAEYPDDAPCTFNAAHYTNLPNYDEISSLSHLAGNKAKAQ